MDWNGDWLVWNVVKTNIRHRGACQASGRGGLGYLAVVDRSMAWAVLQHGVPSLNSMARERGVELGVAGMGGHIWNVSCESDIMWGSPHPTHNV